MKFLELIQTLSAIALHEVAHIFAAKILGIRCTSPTLLPIGIKLTVNHKESAPLKELVVCLAGSAVGIVVGLLVTCLFDDSLNSFIFASFALSILNLLPIKGLDGGEALNVIANRLFLPDTAHSITQKTSEVTVLILWFITVSVHMYGANNFPMLFFAIYLLYSHL